MSSAVKLFHIGALGWYTYVVHYSFNSLITNISSDDRDAQTIRKFPLLFLTTWTFGVQLLYFAVCVLGYFLNIIPKLHRVRDKVINFGNSIFITVAGPMPLVVTILFWVLYIIDREIVYPKWSDRIIPLWINHTVHTANSIFPILDMCLVNHKFPSHLFAMKSICGFIVAYYTCFFGTYFLTGIWIYPNFKELTWPRIVLLCAVLWILAMALYAFLFLFHKVLWGSEKEEPAKQINQTMEYRSNKKSA